MDGRADGHGKQFVAWAGQRLRDRQPALEPLAPGKGRVLCCSKWQIHQRIGCAGAVRPPGPVRKRATSPRSAASWPGCRPALELLGRARVEGSVEGRVGKQEGAGLVSICTTTCGCRARKPPRRGISQRAAKVATAASRTAPAYRHRSWRPGVALLAHSRRSATWRVGAPRGVRVSPARTRKQTMPQIFLQRSHLARHGALGQGSPAPRGVTHVACRGLKTQEGLGGWNAAAHGAAILSDIPYFA